MSIRLPSRIVARAAYVSRPTLRVKTLTRGRAPLSNCPKKGRHLCQILRRPAACVKLWPPAGPRVKVSNVGRPRGPYYSIPPLQDATGCRPGGGARSAVGVI